MPLRPDIDNDPTHPAMRAWSSFSKTSQYGNALVKGTRVLYEIEAGLIAENFPNIEAFALAIFLRGYIQGSNNEEEGLHKPGHKL